MKLRKLESKDAPLMLEWMHDESVVCGLNADFLEKTLDDCIKFIDISQNIDTDLHLAVTDDNDTYMGTVSLKHIDNINKTAEFAITVRKSAMGHGYSKYAMSEILKMGIHELGLDNIFWCVSELNPRAVRFYDKNDYQRVKNIPESITCNYDEQLLKKFIWYKYSGQ